MRLSLVIAVLGCLAGPAHAGGVQATFDTLTMNGTFAPENCVAVWVEDASGKFVKTIGRWSGAGGLAGDRTIHLVAWRAKAGTADVDAVSGATRIDHGQPLAVTWDLTNKAGQVVPDGTYTIRMEMTEENSTSAMQNNQGRFTFVKSTNPQKQTGMTMTGFSNVAIDYMPAPGTSTPTTPTDPNDPCVDPTSPTCTGSGEELEADVIGGCAASRSSSPFVLALFALLALRRPRTRSAKRRE